MKVLITIIGLVFILFSDNVFCQSGSIWYFGGADAWGIPTNDAAGLDFTTNPPTALPGNEGKLVSYEGNATLSDNYGNLFFYTDGSSVFDKTHTVMPNGNGLFGNASSTQSAIVAPVPGSVEEFYVFTNQAFNPGPFLGLSYSKVDMTLAGNGTVSCPLGDVVPGIKNIPLADSTSEKVTIVPHSNGIDYWIVFQEAPWNQITSLLVTNAGVNVLPATPVISASPYWGGMLGEMKSSSDGNYLALAHILLRNPSLPLPGAYVQESELQLLGFDPNTGALIPANCFKLDSISSGLFGFYGVEFSSSGDYLYANNSPLGELYQFDMNAFNIPFSKIVVGTGVSSSLQLAPNAKIYQARPNNNSIDVINDPNLPGLACGFVGLGQTIGTGVCKTGLPNSPLSSILSSVFSNYIVNDTTICNGSSVSIGNTIKPNHTYSWSPAISLSDSTLSSPVATPTVTTTYYLFSQHNCDTILDSVTVFIEIAPDAGLGNTMTMCSTGAIVNLFDSLGGTPNASGMWNPTLSGAHLGTFNPATDPGGIYIYAVSSTPLCPTDSSTVEVTIQASPIVSITQEDDNCQQGIGSITTTLISGVTPFTYNWNPPSTDSTLTGLTEGTYTLIVVDSIGCQNTYVVDILNMELDCYQHIYLPNVFSPNADGQNDILYVRGKGVASITLKIYNRWGNKVFESNDMAQGWDGTYNGNEQGNAVFVYYISATFVNGQTVEKKGNVSIVK